MWVGVRSNLSAGVCAIVNISRARPLLIGKGVHFGGMNEGEWGMRDELVERGEAVARFGGVAGRGGNFCGAEVVTHHFFFPQQSTREGGGG